MHGLLLCVTLFWGHTDRALCAPDSVRPLDKAAYAALCGTLRADDRRYVVLDAQGRIDGWRVNRHDSESLNYQAVKTLVNSAYVVDVTVGNAYRYRDASDSVQRGGLSAVYTSDLGDATQYMVQYTAEQLKAMGYRDALRASGPSGITLLPGGEGDPHGDGKGSANGHVVVVISSDLTARDAARKLAHEAYGHALFFVQHKDPNHAEDKTRGGNQVLEDQIQARVEETETNFDAGATRGGKKTRGY